MAWYGNSTALKTSIFLGYSHQNKKINSGQQVTSRQKIWWQKMYYSDLKWHTLWLSKHVDF